MTTPPLETVPETAVPGEDVSGEDPVTHTDTHNDHEETTTPVSDGASESDPEPPNRTPSASVAPETVYAAASELQRAGHGAGRRGGPNVDANEVLNDRAVSVMRRMSHKLTGRDGAPGSAIAGAAGAAAEGFPRAPSLARAPPPARMSRTPRRTASTRRSSGSSSPRPATNLCQSYRLVSVLVERTRVRRVSRDDSIWRRVPSPREERREEGT